VIMLCGRGGAARGEVVIGAVCCPNRLHSGDQPRRTRELRPRPQAPEAAAPAFRIAQPQPGLGQLDGLLEQVRGTGLPVQLRVRGRPRPVPGTTGLTLYRAVQEALTNTRQHARGVTWATVTFTWRPGELDLVMSDDGRSAGASVVSPMGATPATGMGLAGMRERVSAVGGTMTARPGPDAGWRVHVSLPLGPAEPA